MEERKMRPRGPRKSRRKVCGFCVDKLDHIDYKDTARPVSYTHLVGYFCADLDHKKEAPVFNRAVGLKDSFKVN